MDHLTHTTTLFYSCCSRFYSVGHGGWLSLLHLQGTTAQGCSQKGVVIVKTHVPHTRTPFCMAFSPSSHALHPTYTTYNAGQCIYKYILFISTTLVNAILVDRHVVSIPDHEQQADVYYICVCVLN